MTQPQASDLLRMEALDILDDLDLLARLGRFGRAELVGSVALDLVVKRDIDVHVLLREPGLFAVSDAVYRELLDHPRVREVRITDYRVQSSLKLAVDAYPGPSGAWSIDIWLTEREEETAFADRDALLAALTPEHRAAILEIKRHYDARGLLRDGLSTRIYRAVVHGGVRTVEEFAGLPTDLS